MKKQWIGTQVASYLLAMGCSIFPSLAPASSLVQSKQDQVMFNRFNALNWAPVLDDSGSGNWQEHWLLDGAFASVDKTEEGLVFSAGPEEWNHAHHAVLWTKQAFSGDLKIEYDYTRLDEINKWVNILYIQATGKGGEFSTDIMDWADYRKEPWMKHYFETMKLLHISYAAYGKEDHGVQDDYVRCRRYPKPETGDFSASTQIPPDAFHTGLFKPQVTYRVTALKKGDHLFFKVEHEGEETLFHWQSPLIEEVTEGRIGLRHMWMKSSRYTNFKVSTIAPPSL